MIDELKTLLESNNIADDVFHKIIYDNLVTGLFVLLVNEMKDEEFRIDLKKRINTSLNKKVTIRNILLEKFGSKISEIESHRIYCYIEAYFQKTLVRIPYSKEIRTGVLKNQSGKCAICGTRILLNNSELDHIIPWNFVGDELGSKNLQMLCKKCNRRKGKNINFNTLMFLVNKENR